MSSNYNNLKRKNSNAQQILRQGASVTVVDREQWESLLTVLETNSQMIDLYNKTLSDKASSQTVKDLSTQVGNLSDSMDKSVKNKTKESMLKASAIMLVIQIISNLISVSWICIS